MTATWPRRWPVTMPSAVTDGSIFVGGRESREMRDVAHLTVVEMGASDDPLLPVRVLEDAAGLGEQFQANATVAFGLIDAATFGDPLPEQLIGIVGGAELQAAAVVHGHRGLQQQQALFRLDAVGAASLFAAGERTLVHRVVVGLQRELEAALAAGRAMARAGVAALPREGGKRLSAEGDGGRLAAAGDGDRHRERFVADMHGEFGVAVARGSNQTVAEIGDRGIGRSHAGAVREIGDRAVREVPGYEQSRPVALGV